MLWLDTSVEEDSLKVYSAGEIDIKLEGLDLKYTKRCTELSNAKADKATTLAGYGITDSYTKTEVNTIKSNLEKYVDQAEIDAVAESKKYVEDLKIAKTYATKTEVSNLTNTVDSKADKKDTYTKNDIDSKEGELNSKIDGKLGKGETASNSSKLNGQNPSYYATKQSVDSLQEIVNKKADSEDVNTKSEVDKKIQNAFNKFATDISTDGIVNTYKELIDYASEHSSEIVELVGELSEAQSDITDLKKNKIDTTTFEETLQELDQAYGEVHEHLLNEIEGKADKSELIDKEGYYPSMSVGMADNLVGRGDVQDAHINFRPSAGVANITDGAARIKAIKGNSVVWNQWWKTSYTIQNVVRTNVAYNGNTVTLSHIGGENTAEAKWAAYNMNALPLNHKIYVSFVGNLNGKMRMGVYKGGSVNAIPLLEGSGETRLYESISDTSSGADNIAGTADDVNVVGGALIGVDTVLTFDTATLRVIDLTQMFGETIVNEIATASDPIAKFNELKPMNIEDEYTYNNGEIISVKVDALKSVGDNAYNSKQVIARVMGGHAYEITANEGAKLEVSFYADGEDDNEEREIAPNSDGEYIFPANGYCYVNGAPHEEVCVCVKHSYPKHSKYYEENTKDLSWIADIEYKGAPLFPNGMRSAGSAYDEIYFDRTAKKWKAMKRIGEVDMSKVHWIMFPDKTTYKPYGFIYGDIPEKNKGRLNVLSTKYPNKGDFMKNKTLFGNANGASLYVIDDSYADLETFKTDMAGEILYYELAEPIVVTLDYPTVETNMDYLVWDFGTEEAIASIPSAPFRADIVYDFNATDDIRSLSTKVTTLETKVNGKQDKISVTTKSNGNIVLLGKEFMPATPSGDPQHYAYEAVGAVYNATGADTTTTGIYGDTIVHKAGHWLYNEIGDLTNEDMCTVLEYRAN